MAAVPGGWPDQRGLACLRDCEKLVAAMIWIVSLVLIAVVVALFVVVVGNRLPREHRVTRVTYLNRSPAEVWRTIGDFSAQVEWRPDLKSVERLAPRRGRDRWRETDASGQSITLETVESIPHRRLVRGIVGDGPDLGTWTIEIAEVGEVSSLSVTETAQIDNPVFRFLSALGTGQQSAIDRYLVALGKRLGVEVTIVDG